jgi:hopanoid biosynthesis associated RND transporter like protein HpnN
MMARTLERLVAHCVRHAMAVVLAFLVLAAGCIGLAATHLAVSTDIGGLFSMSLPWKQREAALKHDFPQFSSLIVAVVDAKLPEEADATAAGLAAALAPDHAHFRSVREPENSPYLNQEGLLFLPETTLQDLLDTTVDAEPFLGQLAADPSARGLFGALSLIAAGARHGQLPPASFDPALRTFHDTLAGALAGHARPLSWQNLLAGPAASLAGPDRIVLLQPRLDFTSVQPGGAATQAMRRAAAGLEFVRNGDAHVHVTGDVPLSDEEFGSAAKGAVSGLLASFVLVLVWLFLALRSWRLIVPVMLTLLLGLALTTGFAALAVGTLNLISVAFAILFVGIAVDFAIQFTVRFREMRHETVAAGGDAVPPALAQTGRRVGGQVLIASLATASGFLAFVPTNFRGVAELGLIAGAGMLIAFICTLSFLPAMLSLMHPRREGADIGFARAAVIDRALARWRWPVVAVFGVVFAAGLAAGTRLTFDSNTLHTKSADSEAVQTLMRLLHNPVTNPFTIDIVRPSVAGAAALAPALDRLSLVDHTVNLLSLVPAGQPGKLAAIADAASVLAPVLQPPAALPAPNAASLRAAASATAGVLAPVLGQLPAGSPLRDIVGDLRALATASDSDVMATNAALVRFLPAQLRRLRLALAAKPVTQADIPAGLRRDYVLPDGQARIQVVPKQAVSESDALRRFVEQVQKVAPDAGGPAVAIASTAATITGAFIQAGLSAVAAIAVILLVALRRWRDAALVLAPLLLSASMTALFVVLAGMQLNYANVIALPLLLGVGVSFNIYFVLNWRAGEAARLASPTARAVIFSALTTGTAFGSLAASYHPGTASMGKLLLISLGCTLLATLVFVPALLAVLGPAKPTPITAADSPGEHIS